MGIGKDLLLHIFTTYFGWMIIYFDMNLALQVEALLQCPYFRPPVQSWGAQKGAGAYGFVWRGVPEMAVLIGKMIIHQWILGVLYFQTIPYFEISWSGQGWNLEARIGQRTDMELEWADCRCS